MKKLLLILLCLPIIGFGQQLTYVPDDNFEQALINLGYDGVLDNYIYTSMANTITDLTIYGSGTGSAVGQIYDFTGIEDMPITHLELYNLDSISSMDFSMLPDLMYLTLLGFDELETINISNNLNLVQINLLHASSLLSIDVSNNINLKGIQITNSPISSLDLSNNPLYGGGSSGVNLHNNTNLSSLNLRNGYNTYMGAPALNYNSQLYCIDVDDWEYSLLNWGFVEPQITYSNNCSSGTDIDDYQQNRKIYKVTNLLGKETKGIKNEFLFYIFEDGTVEKRIIIE